LTIAQKWSKILMVLLHQLTLEELYEAWGAKGKEESRKNTAVL
jgi:hypothetical protein